MPRRHFSHERRRWLRWGAAGAASGLGAGLAACGGGGDTPSAAPRIDGFSNQREPLHVGDRARVVAIFSGGSGRIEPGLGPAVSGVAVDTPVLDGPRALQLVVESPGQAPATRTLALAVGYRDRYQVLARRFVVSGHAAIGLADGRVLVTGGSRAQSAYSDQVDRYDPATGQWEALSPLSGGCSEHQAIALADGRVLIAGGARISGSGRSLDLIDPVRGTTTSAGELQVTRRHTAAVRLPDGRVAFFGGNTAGEGAPLGISDSAEVWDPATGRSRLLSTRLAMGRTGHQATLLGDGRVLITGGYGLPPTYHYAEVYDPRSERFTPIAAPVTAARAHQAVLPEADGRLLLLGGETPTADGGLAAIPDVLRFDAVSGAFTALPPLARPRTLAAAVTTRDGRVLLFGGETQIGRANDDAEAYDPRSGGRPIAALDHARAYLSAHRLPDGRILLVGGEDGSGRFAETVLLYE